MPVYNKADANFEDYLKSINDPCTYPEFNVKRTFQ